MQVMFDLKSSDVSKTLNQRELYISNLDEKEVDPELEHQEIENFDFLLLRYFDSGDNGSKGHSFCLAPPGHAV
ncbi:hypothetical protein L2E82_50382 [Cichorium intybus]|nr:hypothetical protein L2E82_50382 [Cichorium intybus]